MSLEARAAQFMPFAALTGYYDLVRQKEHVTEPRRTLTQERVEAASAVLARLRRGDRVRVTHYVTDAYVTQEGLVAHIDPALHELQVVRTHIRFEDIFEVKQLP